MAQMTGSDVGDLESGAVRLESLGSQIGGMQRPLRSQLYSSHWEGRAAERFRNQWDTVHGPALSNADDFLRNAGQRLRTEADQQRQASNMGGGGSPAVVARDLAIDFGAFGTGVSGLLEAIGPLVDRMDLIEALGELWGFSKNALALENLRDLLDLASDWGGVPVTDEALRGLARIGYAPGVLDLVGIGIDGWEWISAIRTGDTGEVVMGGAGLVISGVALMNPKVRLLKAGWDGGYWMGTQIAEHTGVSDAVSESVHDSYIERTYGTDELTTAQATEISQRYDGVRGFGRFVGDSVADVRERAF